jgi:hypothetical protein
MPKATLVIKDTIITDAGVAHISVWKVPSPVPPSEHPYKYRLALVVDGERVIGYDNERGKGDHKHRDGGESDYTFSSPQQLIRDFMTDIKEFQDENI